MPGVKPGVPRTSLRALVCPVGPLPASHCVCSVTWTERRAAWSGAAYSRCVGWGWQGAEEGCRWPSLLFPRAGACWPVFWEEGDPSLPRELGEGGGESSSRREKLDMEFEFFQEQTKISLPVC